MLSGSAPTSSPERGFPVSVRLTISLFAVLLFITVPVFSTLSEENIGTRAEAEPSGSSGIAGSWETRATPEIRVSKDFMFRAESALISIFPDGGITERWCEISFTKDNSTWLDLPVRVAEDHFQADFHTSHSNSAGAYYFQGEVGDRSGGSSEQSGVAKITVKNNPPTAFIYAESNKMAAGYEYMFDAGGSFDLDGNITDYNWDFGDNTSSAGMKVTHEYNEVGDYLVDLTVTDNEGGTMTVKASIAVVTNLLGTGQTVFTYGEKNTVDLLGDVKVEGNVVIQYNETTLLGLDTLEMNIQKNGNIDNPAGIRTETWKEYDPTTGYFTSFWRCSFDSRELDDGEYEFVIKNTERSMEISFEVDNEPPVWSFFFIGLGLFVLTALAASLIQWLRRKKLRKMLMDIDYESKDVFRYVPEVSLISFFASLAFLFFLFFIIINIVNSWLYGLLLMFGIAVSALFAHLSFMGKKTAITIIGALLCCGTGSLYLIALLDSFIFALMGTVIFVLITCAEIFSHLLFNRNYLMLFQNREENTTSVGTNMTLNAFDIYRDREAERKRNNKLFGTPTALVPLINFIATVIMIGSAGAPRGPKIVKPKRETPEWKKKIYKAKIHGKISYTRFTTNEVKIGVFDVNDWGRDMKLADILLVQFLRLMSRKKNKKPFANSVKIKLMSGDPHAREKKKLLGSRGFTRIADEGSSSVEILRLDIA